MFGYNLFTLALFLLPLIILLLVILPIISALGIKEYAVYEKAKLREVVKIGFSWPAFFFDWIWAFVKRLWLPGVIYLAIQIIALIVIFVFISESKAEIEIIMGLMQLIGSLIFGVSGNNWVESKLNEEGFNFVGKVMGKRVDEAKNLAAHTLAEQGLRGPRPYEGSPGLEPGLMAGPAIWSIYARSGPLAGASVDLTAAPLIIGRDPKEANLTITSNSGISRRHCLIRFDNSNNNILIEDCGSTNGTFLENGTRLEIGKTYSLKGGDRFYLINPGILFEVRNR